MRKLWPSETYKTMLTRPLSSVRLISKLSTTTSRPEMNNSIVTLLLLCGVYGVSAGRRYIAIPIDGLDVIELSPVTLPVPRITRQTEAYVPVEVPSVSQEELKNPRAERSAAHILDYVDFGGQTNSNGAFSWYADYPAHH
ncbi:uncharacterized protein LOC114879113 [Osmia bicornis bicornis]|uniref:uncharacterized protein LOC114879113 n=1 Tax=Osmia bicornis bicornis TaxID=1437191 RepID=UPI0010F8ED9B|nr:uncharacterized protein LOC114879113 [Osmia bicornis bicornis]XP_029049549.1 uncharacterized protein LOC114879113 [Osmia bicornis bicornis]XP_034183220.1 uncharacterized protein LOC117605702 [Osmia lignaria]